MKGVAARFPSPQRILVRGVNWLGDAVMTTPALQRLRQRFPHAQIGLLTAVKLAPLWQGHPDIDRLLAFQPGESRCGFPYAGYFGFASSKVRRMNLSSCRPRTLASFTTNVQLCPMASDASLKIRPNSA